MCITFSKHVIEKHINSDYKNNNITASVFTSKNLFILSVTECLKDPDYCLKLTSKKFKFEKKFEFNIGTLGYAQKYTQRVRVIAVFEKGYIHIISAYPIY